MVSNLNVSNSPSNQADTSAPVAVSVDLSATAQTAAETNQNIDTSDINNYAQAVLEIEDIRVATLNRIQTLLGSDTVPSIACHQEDTVSTLESEAQELVVAFCQDSISLVKQAGLSVEEFNQITNEQRNDEALQTAIQDALVRLQTTEEDAS